MDFPDLRELCTVKIYLNRGTLNLCIRDAQIKLCRHLLFCYDQIVASPNPEQFDEITVIMARSFYKTGKVQAMTEIYATTMESPKRVTAAQLQACLSYTIILRLSPQWNKAGHLLIQGADFLSKSGKQDAVDMRIIVSDAQICICLQVQKIQLPPSELSDFGISVGTLQRFFNDPHFVIQRHFIANNWCYILPSMKMGQIVSIGHTISSETPFKSYKDFQNYWNMLYGYELPSMAEDTVIYCNVYFKLIGEKLFTYPSICLRSQPIQFFPRVDTEGIVKAFICDLKSKMSHLCGFPVNVNGNPVYTVKELTRPLSQGKTSLVNLIAKLPSESPSLFSRYNAGTSQKMGPLMQTTEEHVLERKAKTTSATLQMKPFTSPPQPFQILCSSVRHEGTAQRYVPVFHKKNVGVNSGQDKSMFRSCITHSFKEHNSTSVTANSMMFLSKPTQPSMSQIIEAKENLSVNKMANQPMIMKNNKDKIGSIMNATQHPNSFAIGEQWLCSASCQMQVRPRAVPNPCGTKLLQSTTSESCKTKCVKQVPTDISHKNQNAENVNPTSTECLKREIKIKGKSFDFTPKMCRSKESISEVDVLKHAQNNELHKLHNATLHNWLKQHGISTKARNKKEQLVAKIVQFLQE
ncbi:uncharacterized protein C18orf63 homolog [Pyxicephalus adspersus]|uniref:uncharacterized protein C18orf63 homolog n=1 Tax=Pyxicephalus adspersus TaxID=30357 RepID=UPI003B594D0A